MTDDDDIVFGQALGTLAVTLGEPMNKARVAGYFLALRDLDLEAVLGAIRTAMATAKFFPKPVELRELAGAGLADVGLVEALIVRHLRRVTWPPEPPRDPFLALVLQRLGGMRVASEMPAGVRFSVLKAILPALVPAALARGLAVPRQSDVPLVAIQGGRAEQRRLTGAGA